MSLFVPFHLNCSLLLLAEYENSSIAPYRWSLLSSQIVQYVILFLHCHWFFGWWSGVVASALALINEVNQRQALLVLRWATVSGFNSRCWTFISVCNQPATKANSAVHPSGVSKWVPASAGKAKAGMVHSISGWTQGVQVKLWDPLRMCAIPERLRGVFTMRCYTNSRLPLPYLYLLWFRIKCIVICNGLL